MAKGLIEIALQLGKNLGANTSKFMGTKSNVTFLGSGPKDGMLFQKDINPESFASIGIEKVLPDIETSLGYAVGGKLNDIQLNKLIDNMSMMADMIDPLAPKNVIDLATRTRNLDQEGLASLRLMSDDFGNIAPEEAAKLKELKNIDVPSKALSDTDRSGLMSRLDEIVKKKQTEAAATKAPIDELENYTKSEGDIIQDLVDRKFGVGYFDNVGGTPAQRGSAREFLVEALKKENPNQTNFSDIITAEDVKAITEGGGGQAGDPLALVDKYFGPRIAEMLPSGGTTEEIAIFTDKVLNNVVDANGLRPGDPRFDRLTAKFIDSLAEGGIAGLDTRQGLKFGGKISKNILSKIDDKMIKKAADDIFPTDDYKYDAEMVVEALVENNPKLFKNLLADDLDDALRSDLYGLAVRETGGRLAQQIKTRRSAVDKGIVNEVIPEVKSESMKLVDGVTAKGEKFKTFETTKPPRQFTLNVEKAISELNIPREEAIRISQLPSNQQKLELQKYLDRDLSQQITLSDYNPNKFDAAQGGLAKILEV